MPMNQWEQGPSPLVRALRGGAVAQTMRPTGYAPPMGGNIPPIAGGPNRKPMPGNPFGNPLTPGRKPMPTLPPGPLPPANTGGKGLPTVPGNIGPNTGGRGLPDVPPFDPTQKPMPGMPSPGMPPPAVDPIQKPMPGMDMQTGISETLPFDPNQGMPSGPPQDGGLMAGAPVKSFPPRTGVPPAPTTGLGRLMPKRAF